MKASGGVTPYTWTVSVGNLPSGLALSAAGVISGTPTTAGVSDFTLQVTDNVGAKAFQAMEIVVSGATTSGNSPTSSAYHVFPQFADGQLGGVYYRTTLMISNPSSTTAATCSVQLYGLTVPGFVLSYNLAASGWLIAQTDGTQAFQSGYATLQCSSSVEAQLLYSLYLSNGTKLSEATVFSSPPGAMLDVVADQRENAQLGLAIANDSDQSVTYTIAVGGANQTGSVTLAPRTSVAKFINQFVSGVAANTAVLVQVSSSTGKASVIGLRFTGNVFTTIPATLSGSADATANSYHVFPQFADGRFSDGSYYRTTRIYSNPSATATVSCTTQLRGMTTDGNSSFSGNLSPGGTIVAPTNGTQTFQSGYATMQCSGLVDAQVLYSFYSSTGAKLSEATVFSSPSSKTVQILADSRGGAEVGLAISNDSDQTNTYTIVVGDVNGNLVGTATQTLGPRSSIAKFVNEFVTLPANHYGQVIVSSSTGTASVIGLRFTGSVFTTIPETIR
jgi:hypothetical protein